MNEGSQFIFPVRQKRKKNVVRSVGRMWRDREEEGEDEGNEWVGEWGR